MIVKKFQNSKFLLLFFFLTVFLLFGSQGFCLEMYDYGDNPAWFGAASRADGTNEWLGSVQPDYEPANQPSLNSNADDLNGIDDEEGVSFLGSYWDEAGTNPYSPKYVGGYWGQIDISVSVSQWDSGRYGPNDLLYIDGYIDWSHDGGYDDTGVIKDNFPVNPGEAWDEHSISFSTDPSTWGQNFKTFSLSFIIGEAAQPGPVYGRFLLNYDEGVNPSTGFKTYGEVEDYGGISHGDPAQEPLPEPSTFLLLGAGLIGAGIVARKRSKS